MIHTNNYQPMTNTNVSFLLGVALTIPFWKFFFRLGEKLGVGVLNFFRCKHERSPAK